MIDSGGPWLHSMQQNVSKFTQIAVGEIVQPDREGLFALLELAVVNLVVFNAFS